MIFTKMSFISPKDLKKTLFSLNIYQSPFDTTNSLCSLMLCLHAVPSCCARLLCSAQRPQRAAPWPCLGRPHPTTTQDPRFRVHAKVSCIVYECCSESFISHRIVSHRSNLQLGLLAYLISISVRGSLQNRHGERLPHVSMLGWEMAASSPRSG